MANRTYVPKSTGVQGITAGLEMVRVEDIHVRYRLYEDVRKSLGKIVASAGRRRRYREVHAIRGVSFSAAAGEVIGVIGANGSGKTTLMRAITGLLPVDEGAVYARATPMLLGVGAVLNKSLSGRRNIMLGGLALGLTKKQVLRKEQRIINFAGIGHAIDWPMKTYSSGMSARLQFAISAAVKPEILVIDEALSVGDRQFKRKSARRIQRLREDAGTVFIVSHNMSQIRQSCTRALWLNEGEIVVDGDPDDVVAAYNNDHPKKDERVARRRRKAERTMRKLAEVDADAAAAVAKEIVGRRLGVQTESPMDAPSESPPESPPDALATHTEARAGEPADTPAEVPAEARAEEPADSRSA